MNYEKEIDCLACLPHMTLVILTIKWNINHKRLSIENFTKTDHHNQGLEAINHYHKALDLGCCRSPRSASDNIKFNREVMICIYPNKSFIESFIGRSVSFLENLAYVPNDRVPPWKYNNTRNIISFSVSKISFIF